MQYRLNPLKPTQVTDQINRLLRDVGRQVRFHGNYLPTLAVDITDKEWYGDSEHEFSTGSKPKNGTDYSNRYFTATVIHPAWRLPVYVTPLFRQSYKQPDVLIGDLLAAVDSMSLT